MNNLKKYLLVFFAAFAALTACVKEEMDMVESGDLISFSATYADPLSKTVLGELIPMWTPEDTIVVYDGNNNVFVNSLTEKAVTAEFKGKLEGQGLERKSFIAAVPFNEAYTFSFVGSFVGGMRVLTEQTAVEGSYDPKSAPAAAFADSTSLTFNNAYSLVKFTIVSDGVKEVTLAATASESIAGKMNVAKADPLKLTVTKGESLVTLKGDFKKGSTYYMATIPATLNKGFTLSLKSSAGATVESLKYSKKIELKRSAILNVGDLSLTPTVNQNPDDENSGENGGENGDGNNGENGGENGDENNGDNGDVNEDGNNGENGNENGNNGGNIDTPAVTIYLHPGKEWMSDGARFAAYFFGNGEVWVDMTDADGDGNYECKLPTGGYTSVIFTRMNPAFTDNNWNNETESRVWNQSPDLDVPTGNAVCFVINPGKWNPEDSDFGYWTTFPPVVDEQPDNGGNTGGDNTGNTSVRIYLSNAWGWPLIWCWDPSNNDQQIFEGAQWPGTRYHGEENGYYYWDVPEAYVGKTVSLLAVKEDQSEQTSDYTDVKLDKSVYFYLEWTSELGCHLIMENK